MVVGGGYTLLYVVAAGGIFYNAVDIWGEGVVYEAYRLCFAFPPSYVFESQDLYNWAIREFGPIS